MPGGAGPGGSHESLEHSDLSLILVTGLLGDLPAGLLGAPTGGRPGDPQETPQETPGSLPGGSREAPGNPKLLRDLSLILVKRLTREASQQASRKSTQEAHRGLPD